MFISTAVSKVNSALLSINAGEGMILSIRLKYSTDKRVNLSSHSVGRNKCILDASVRIIFHFSIPNRLDKHIFIRVNVTGKDMIISIEIMNGTWQDISQGLRHYTRQDIVFDTGRDRIGCFKFLTGGIIKSRYTRGTS